MNTEKEKVKIKASIEKLREARKNYAERLQQQKANEISAAFAAIDGISPPNGGLTFDDLTLIEANFNQPICALKEKLRQISNLEKQALIDAAPAKIESLDKDISRLRRELAERETERRTLDNEARNLTGHLRVSGGPSGAVVYVPRAKNILNAHMSGPRQQEILDFILGY